MNGTICPLKLFHYSFSKVIIQHLEIFHTSGSKHLSVHLRHRERTKYKYITFVLLLSATSVTKVNSLSILGNDMNRIFTILLWFLAIVRILSVCIFIQRRISTH